MVLDTVLPPVDRPVGSAGGSARSDSGWAQGRADQLSIQVPTLTHWSFFASTISTAWWPRCLSVEKVSGGVRPPVSKSLIFSIWAESVSAFTHLPTLSSASRRTSPPTHEIVAAVPIDASAL